MKMKTCKMRPRMSELLEKIHKMLEMTKKMRKASATMTMKMEPQLATQSHDQEPQDEQVADHL
jgi:hypothetical protein